MERLALAVLNSAMDDFESVQSVALELAALLGENVSEQDLLSVFRSLEAAGLVEAYRQSDGRLIPTESSEQDLPRDLWFLATFKGREIVNRSWDQVFGANS